MKNETTLTAGTEVRYSNPINEVEAQMTLVVLEDRGNSVLVEYRENENFGIFPTELLPKTEVEIK